MSDVWFRGIPTGDSYAVAERAWSGDLAGAYDMVRSNVEEGGDWWTPWLSEALRFGGLVLVAKGDPGSKMPGGNRFPEWRENLDIVDVLLDTLRPDSYEPVLLSLRTGEAHDADGAPYGGKNDEFTRRYASGSSRQGSLTPALREQIMGLREQHCVADNPKVCGTFTARIERELGLGRQVGFFKGNGFHAQHVWNTLPDGTIVDATADQFDGYPAINVAPANSPDYQPLTPEQEEWLEWFRIDSGGRSPSMMDWAFWRDQYEDYVKPGIVRHDPFEQFLGSRTSAGPQIEVKVRHSTTADVIARDDSGTVIAQVIMMSRTSMGYPEVLSAYVDPAFRRQGLATRMVRAGADALGMAVEEFTSETLTPAGAGLLESLTGRPHEVNLGVDPDNYEQNIRNRFERGL